MEKFDIVIVGAGPIGLSTAYQLSKAGISVAVIEQFHFKNQNSSSSGATRQFRLQYSEDYMSILAMESVPFWDELESYSNAELRTNVGSLWFGDMDAASSEGQIKQAIETMTKLNIPYDLLSKDEIEKNFNFENLKESYKGFYQKDGGTINVSSTLETLYKLCLDSQKVTFFFNEKVQSVLSNKSVTIQTTNRIIYSSKVFIASGPFSKNLLKDFEVNLDYEIWDMVSMYFKMNNTSKDLPSWFIFEEEQQSDPGLYYGFENCSWDNQNYLRVAPAFATNKYTNSSEVRLPPNQEDIDLTSMWVKKHLIFLNPEPQFISNCLASIPNDPNKKLYLDFVEDNILHFSSGWSFKFVPLLGKICSDLLLKGSTNYDISHFRFDNPKYQTLKSINRRIPF